MNRNLCCKTLFYCIFLLQETESRGLLIRSFYQVNKIEKNISFPIFWHEFQRGSKNLVAGDFINDSFFILFIYFSVLVYATAIKDECIWRIFTSKLSIVASTVCDMFRA